MSYQSEFIKFWEFVKIINWDQMIKSKQRYNVNDTIMKAAPYFTWEEYLSFYKIYRCYYNVLDSKFKDTVLNLSISDDGYCDLISSIIGKGYEVYSKIDEEEFIRMGREHDYKENFGYLLMQEQRMYIDEIKMRYESIRRDSKINLITHDTEI